MCRIHIHFFSTRARDNEVPLRQRMLAFTYRYQIVGCIFTTELVRQLICIRVSMIVRCSSSSSSSIVPFFSLSVSIIINDKFGSEKSSLIKHEYII
uniref:Uncharacterized protein n=1 Tax=Trichogramma kaykai TaxID=54128 RepID=A0ABD2XH73_9HYME